VTEIQSSFYLPLADTVNNVCFLFFFFPPPCGASTGSFVDAAGGVVEPLFDPAAQPAGEVLSIPFILDTICARSDPPKSACLSAEVNPREPVELEGKPGKAAADGGFGAFFWPLALVVEKLTDLG
jgi:hypothetical protein